MMKLSELDRFLCFFASLVQYFMRIIDEKNVAEDYFVRENISFAICSAASLFPKPPAA